MKPIKPHFGFAYWINELWELNAHKRTDNSPQALEHIKTEWAKQPFTNLVKRVIDLREREKQLAA